ncbi:unnamed protein product [Acanthosepion pharaonis]|uniref:Uncharacterized protein n=1 Tax=Acanthosepion pharaonis TaxID=158019 RepID=A0A812DJJ6_ACAPH|nr:unnamed protein product [Sepia pharaonis]
MHFPFFLVPISHHMYLPSFSLNSFFFMFLFHIQRTSHILLKLFNFFTLFFLVYYLFLNFFAKVASFLYFIKRSLFFHLLTLFSVDFLSFLILFFSFSSSLTLPFTTDKERNPRHHQSANHVFLSNFSFFSYNNTCSLFSFFSALSFAFPARF